MRRAFSDTLVKMAAANDRVIFLTGDLGFQVFDAFKAGFPGRYVNVGVAEAQLMCAAAGLALEGWRPIAYSIASFATARPYEQIRISICYHQLPVMVVGAGGGYTYARSGVTHHAADDLALMSLLPGMTVTAPGSPEEVAELMPQLLSIPGPSYLRIGKFGERNYAAAEPVRLGKARLVRDGSGIAVVTTGDLAVEAVEAADRLAADGIKPMVCQMHTVKPLDTAALENMAARASVMIVVEEHVPCGGLFSAISRWQAERTGGARLVRLGPADGLVLGNPERDELRRQQGFDAAAIERACRAAWQAR